MLVADTINDYVNRLKEKQSSATMICFKAEGQGDSKVLSINEFLNKYGNRVMGDMCSDDFRNEDGERNLNQFIKFIY